MGEAPLYSLQFASSSFSVCRATLDTAEPRPRYLTVYRGYTLPSNATSVPLYACEPDATLRAVCALILKKRGYSRARSPL